MEQHLNEIKRLIGALILSVILGFSGFFSWLATWLITGVNQTFLAVELAVQMNSIQPLSGIGFAILVAFYLFYLMTVIYFARMQWCRIQREYDHAARGADANDWKRKLGLAGIDLKRVGYGFLSVVMALFGWILFARLYTLVWP